MAAPNPFWRFSLRAFRDPQARAACLALQDEWDADVNLLLWCGWAGRRQRLLDAASLRSALALVGRWQSEVIAPLRAARRAVKRQPPGSPTAPFALPFGRRLAALELALDRAEQHLLARFWTTLPPCAAAAAHEAIAANLRAYLDLLGVPAAGEVRSQAACIAAACAARSAPARAVAAVTPPRAAALHAS